MTAAYFVHGVALVNVGDELCEACGVRKAVGASVYGHLMCVRCAGLHSHFAEEYAREVEASRKRKGGETSQYRAKMLVAEARANAETERRRAKVSAKMREAGERSNAESQRTARASREEMIVTALTRADTPCSSRVLATLTGMSLASVKRTVAELIAERRVTGKRAHKSCVVFYALRAS